MRYTKFTIKNFKGIKNEIVLDLSKAPSPNIFTLVGLNESGKTSVLEALSLFRHDIDKNHAHEMIHKSKQSNFNDEISVSATLKLDEDDEKRIKDFCKNNLSSYKITKDIDEITVKKSYKFKNSKYESLTPVWNLPLIVKKKRGKKEYALDSIDKISWNKVVDFIDSNFPKILYYENFLFDFPAKIYISNESTIDPTLAEQEYKDVMQDVLDSLEENLTLDQHILARLKSPTEEDKAALDATLGRMSETLTNIIFSSWGEVFSKSNSKGKEIEVSVGYTQGKGYYLQLKIKQGNARFSVSERNLGFRWFFGFLLFIMFRKSRKKDFGETLFLLDEPANNLHQKSQSRLLGVFEKLSGECKIIYSTHSAHMINPKYLSGTYIVKNSAINYEELDGFNANETDISATLYKNFVSKYPDEVDHYKPILDAIDYIPHDMELVERIICLEGKNDYYTFKLMERVIFGSNKRHFYPGASVDKFDSLFRLYLAWQKTLIALFDADKAGIGARDRYVKEISAELGEYIFTLSDIDETWKGKSTEDLFTEEDQLNIIHCSFQNEEKYNKSKFNAALQQLFIDGAVIELSEATKDNFKKVFDFIDKHL